MVRLRTEASSEVLSPLRLSLTFKSAGFAPVTLFGMEVGKQLSSPKVGREGGIEDGASNEKRSRNVAAVTWRVLCAHITFKSLISPPLPSHHSLPPSPSARFSQQPQRRVDRKHLRRRQDSHWPLPRRIRREGECVCVCEGGRTGTMGGGVDGALDSRHFSFSTSCLSVLTPRRENGALDSRRQLSSNNLLPPSVHSSQRSVVSL